MSTEAIRQGCQTFEPDYTRTLRHGLMAVGRDLIGQAETFARSDRTVLDRDSSQRPVHGQQEGSAYNGYFEVT